MTKQDWKKLGITVAGGVLAAYSIKFLRSQGWL